MKNKDNLPLTEFDLATSGTYLQMLKAFIPFMDINEQRILAIAVRIIELTNTIHFFRNLKGPSPLFRNCHDKEYMLKEIKRFCPQKDLEIFEMIDKFQGMGDFMSMYQNMDKSSGETDILKNFLSPEQQKMYETYQQVLNL